MFRILASELYGRQTVPLLWLRLLVIFFIKNDNRKAYVYIRLGQLFRRKGLRVFEKWMSKGLRRDFGCFVSFDSEIGPGLRLPHPNGIVIGQNVTIGARCRIYQQVTLGGGRLGDWQAGRYPHVGDDVTLFSGAKVLGPIHVGDRSTVGANAVVTKDVPPDHVARGIPAKASPARPVQNADARTIDQRADLKDA